MTSRWEQAMGTHFNDKSPDFAKHLLVIWTNSNNLGPSSIPAKVDLKIKNNKLDKIVGLVAWYRKQPISVSYTRKPRRNYNLAQRSTFQTTPT